MNRTFPAVVLVVGGLALAGCGGGSSSGGAQPTSTPNAPSDSAAATAAIKTTYAEFFSDSPAKARTLIEDGSELGKLFKIAAKLQAGQKVAPAAAVKTVTFTSASTANVVYQLSESGNVVLPGADGKAVLQGGQWKVAKDTFCSLIGLQYAKPIPHCE
jgi:hypothetical protein